MTDRFEGDEYTTTTYTFRESGEPLSSKASSLRRGKESNHENIFEYHDCGFLSDYHYQVQGSEGKTRTTYTYNKRGLLTEQICSASDSSKAERKTFQYDREGRVTIMTKTRFDGTTREEYTYGKPGLTYQRTTVTRSREEALTRDTHFSYENDVLTEKIEKTMRGETPSHERITFAYNEQGQLLREGHFDISGKLKKNYMFRYDEAGNVAEKRQLDNTGRISQSWRFEYDENRNQTSRQRLGMAGAIRHMNQYHYTYNDNNQPIKKITYQDNGSEDSVTDYTYDENGNLTSEMERPGTFRNKFSYELEFFPKD